MSKKHKTISSSRLIVVLITVGVVLCVVAGGGIYYASTPEVPDAPLLVSQTSTNTTPKLMGNSALLQPISQTNRLDETPENNLMKGSAQSDARLSIVQTEEAYDASPNLPHIPAPAMSSHTESDAQTDFVYCPHIPLSRELQEFTYERSVEKNLDYPVVLALMWRESRFNVNAVGYNANGTKDHGVMQINDVNRPWLSSELGINNLMDPYENITAGTELLGRMVEKYGMHYGLLAYQYGEQGMNNRVANGFTTNSQTELLYAKGQEFNTLIEHTQAL